MVADQIQDQLHHSILRGRFIPFSHERKCSTDFRFWSVVSESLLLVRAMCRKFRFGTIGTASVIDQDDHDGIELQTVMLETFTAILNLCTNHMQYIQYCTSYCISYTVYEL